MSLLDALKPGESAFLRQPRDVAAVGGVVGAKDGAPAGLGGGSSASTKTKSSFVLQIIGPTPRMAPGYGELVYALRSPNLYVEQEAEEEQRSVGSAGDGPVALEEQVS